MQLSDYAEEAKRKGEQESFLSFTIDALKHESEAALMLGNDFSFEPTRSVLFRSAATLALESKNLRLAEQLIANALSGSPPDETAEELRDLLEDVYFHRHLEVKGVDLDPSEVQMSLVGDSVGRGIAQSDVFVQRVKDFETLLYRTAERHLDMEFREAGRRKKELTEKLEVYVSTPRAASFAVTLRIGKSIQYDFPQISFAGDIMNDLLDGIELISKSDISALKEKIPQDDYRVNFIGLAEKIAPDGENVKAVAFTRVLNNEERYVTLTRSKKEIRSSAKELKKPQKEFEKEFEIKGTLLFADAKKMSRGEIEIVDSDEKSHKIIVPRGMMADIVKPHFEELVVVTALYKENSVVELQSIDLADPEE